MRGARDIVLPGGGNGAGGSVALSAVASSVSSGTVVFSNSNGVTFGLSGSTITASVAAVGGAQTGISGIIVSDATYTSGTVSFSNAGNITINSSVNGATQYIKLSGNAAQTNQSAIKGFGVSNTGATAGNTGISTGIDWVIAGSNLLTLSQSTAAGGPNTVWLQHPAWLTTAMASNRGTDFVQATAGFNGTNASGTIASNAISVSVAAPIPIGTAVKAVASVGSTGTITRYAPEDHQHAGVAAFAVTNTGNTLGNTRSQVGTLFIAASGGITASQSTAAAGNDTIWFSVATPIAQTAQTGISGIIVSDATYTSGTVSFSNAGNITISSSVNGATQYIKLSGNAAQTNQSAIKGLGVSNTGNTAGNTGLSTGIDWVVAGSNNITISQSTAAGGPNTIWVSGPTVGGAQTGISGIIVSDATYTSGTVSFSNAGNITINSSVNGATQYIKLSGNAAQTNQSAIKGFGVSNTGNTLGNTGLSTGIDWVIAGSGAITASQSTAGGGPNTVWMSVAAQTSQSAIKAFGASNTGNTAGNTGVSTGIDWVIAGTNNITVSQSTAAGGPNTIWLSAPNVAAGNVTFSASANSSALGSVIFANSNGVTFGLTTGSQITASVTVPLTGSVYAQGNTTQNSSSTQDYSSVQFGGRGGVSVGFSNGTVQISAPPVTQLTGINGISLSSAGSTISIMPQWNSSFENQSGFNATLTFNGASQSHGVAFELPFPISASFFRLPVSMTTNSTTVATIASATATASAAQYTTWNLVVYSMGVGANSQSLQSVTSSQVGYTFSQQISITNSTQYSVSLGYSAHALGAGTSRSTQYSISNTNYSFTTNQIATEWSGNRMLDIPFGVSLSEGNFWLIAGFSSSSASGGAAGLAGMSNCNVRYSNHYGISMSNISFGIMGSTDLTSGGLMGCGSFSTAGGGTTNSIPISAISSIASNVKPYFQLLRSA